MVRPLKSVELNPPKLTDVVPFIFVVVEKMALSVSW